MSRIDEALKRARQFGRESSPADTAPEPVAAEPDHESVFEAPWDLPARTAEPDRPASRDADDEGDAGEQGHGPGGSRVVVRRFGPKISDRLVTSHETGGVIVERYRRLAATLHHAQTTQGVRSLMITSAIPGEGKTLTATNLALTLAESYRRRVLLVDGDLRRPSLHEVFQVPNLSGLNDGLRLDHERKLPLLQMSDYLTLLTAGRPDPDPMDSLTSGRMRRIVQEAVASFDWVVIDTPPVGLLTDANLLAVMVDAVLLVVRAGSTPFTLVQQASEAVGRERIIGVVLNGVDEEHLHEAYYSRYGYGTYTMGRSKAAPVGSKG